MTKTFRISLLFLPLLLLFSLAACSESKTPEAPGETSTSLPPETEPSHVHDGGTAWKLDLNSHWKICSCGEILEKADHQWIEDTQWTKDCDVCKVEHTNKDDAYLLLTLHDDYYCILYQFYTMDGVLDWTQEFNYIYVEGEAPLYEECEDRMVVYGEAGNILQLSTSYIYERGDKTESLNIYYNESGEMTKKIEKFSFLKDDTRESHEKTYGQDGKVTKEKSEFIYYDENGIKLRQETYENGNLIFLKTYTVSEEGKSVPCMFIDYDQNGKIIYSVKFDKDGNVVSRYQH